MIPPPPRNPPPLLLLEALSYSHPRSKRIFCNKGMLRFFFCHFAIKSFITDAKNQKLNFPSENLLTMSHLYSYIALWGLKGKAINLCLKCLKLSPKGHDINNSTITKIFA